VLIGASAVVEGREPEHIEQRQHEEILPMTYEISNATATASVMFSLQPLLDCLNGAAFRVLMDSPLG